MNLSHKLEVHSFHALGVKYYGHACARDDGLLQVIEGKLKKRMSIPKYRIFVLDESQDLKEINTFQVLLEVCS